MEVTRENTLGIDLGTTYSTAVYEDSNGLLQNVDDGNGTIYIPSVVCGYNQLIVGCPAKKAQSLHPNSTAYEFKRLVARDYNDPVVERLKSQWPFKVVPNKKGIAAIQLEWQGENRVISPEELYNYLVEYICQCAENKTGRRFTNMVLTVPASFNSNQKQNIKNAVETTGRHVIDIIPEPTAAVISFAENEGLENEHVLVYDFGGGTFDVSILHIHDGIYDVLKEDGDPFLGGSDVNECLLHLFLRKIQEETKLEMNVDRLSRRLRDTCEKCKQALSNNESWDDLIDLSPEDYAVRNESAPDMVTVKIDREEMNHEIMPIIGKTLEITERCVAKADLTLSQIGVVAMIGGSSNLDCAVKGVTTLFPDAKIANYGDIRSAVARGAMLWGRQYFSETLVIGGNSSMRLVDDGGRMVFEKEPDPVTNVAVVEKPTNVAVVEKPTNVAVVEKPTNVAVVEKPTNVAVVEKPTNVAVVEKPTNVAVVEKPTNVAVVEKPTNVAVTDKPTNVAVVEKPTNVAVVEKPTNVAVVEKPTNVAVTDKPTNVAVVEKPTNVAVVEKPTNVAVVEKPTNVAVVEKLTNVAVVEKPTNVTITEEPTNVAVADKPTDVTITEEPTNVAVTEEPTNVAVTEKPTNVTVTEKPTNVAVSEKPTNVTVTDKPTNVAVTTTDMPTNVAVVAGDKPTNVVVVPPSTNVKLTPPPPKKPSQRNCLFINSPDAVISIQSENGTDVTGEIAFNGENYVYKQKDGDERVISNEGLQAICQSTILCLSSHDVRQRIETRDGRMNISVENGQLVVSSAADLRVSNISHTSFVAPPPGSPVSPGYPAIISRLNLSIGVATTDDVFSVIIKEGTELPASNTKHYRAASTTPTVIGFEVFQGDSSLCVNNQLIAKANVAGLRKQKKRNLGEVILRMEVDKHGIVSLQYRQPDEKTFRPLKTAVTKKLIIDDKEIEEIKKNADRTREKDCRLAKYRVLKESVGNLIVDYGSHPSHSDEVKKEWKQWVKAHACSKGAIPTTECVSEWEKKKEEIRCVIKQLK
ncbi:hypothetical protein WA556_006248 [Blastocystis sp. ATCC 50177/Nand II]